MSDALFLVAIVKAERNHGPDTDLSSVIETFDQINHDIPTQGEFEGAVRRLIGRGLVGIREEFHPGATSTGDELVARLEGDGIWATIQRVSNSLERAGEAAPSDWALPPQVWRDAVSGWLDRAQKYLRK